MCTDPSITAGRTAELVTNPRELSCLGSALAQIAVAYEIEGQSPTLLNGYSVQNSNLDAYARTASAMAHVVSQVVPLRPAVRIGLNAPAFVQTSTPQSPTGLYL
jgi:hypothetical protein